MDSQEDSFNSNLSKSESSKKKSSKKSNSPRSEKEEESFKAQQQTYSEEEDEEEEANPDKAQEDDEVEAEEEEEGEEDVDGRRQVDSEEIIEEQKEESKDYDQYDKPHSNNQSHTQSQQQHHEESIQREPTLQDFINILEEHRIKSEKEGKYEEAELAERRMEEIKKQAEQKESENMEQRHITDRLELEEAHVLEFNNFNKMMDIKMQVVETHAEDIIKTTEKRQADEVDKYKADLEENPLKFKSSRELLNLRKMQDNLAKTRKYGEARILQEKGNNMQEEELIKWEEMKEKRLNKQLDKLRAKQKIEKDALLARIKSSREESERERAKKMEKLLKRYHNLKKVMENAQNLERQQFLKETSLKSMRKEPKIVKTNYTIVSFDSKISPATKKNASKIGVKGRGYNTKQGPPSIPSTTSK